MPNDPKDRIRELRQERDRLNQQATSQHSPDLQREALRKIDAIERELRTLGDDPTDGGEEIIRGD